MAKQNWKKVFKSKQHLTVEEVSAEEKKKVYIVMHQNGMSMTSAYLRFFQKGFDAWEATGVLRCCANFVYDHPELQLVLERDKYAYAICMQDRDIAIPQMIGILQDLTVSGFYDIVRNNHLHSAFINYMSELGMSRNTTTKRFADDEWKPWELKGIENIITEIQL